MGVGQFVSRAASHTAEGARGVAGYVSHTANRIGTATGATGAFESIAKSSAGQFIGRHKMAAGLITLGTVATVAYNAGGNHRQHLLQQRAATQEQGVQR